MDPPGVTCRDRMLRCNPPLCSTFWKLNGFIFRNKLRSVKGRIRYRAFPLLYCIVRPIWDQSMNLFHSSFPGSEMIFVCFRTAWQTLTQELLSEFLKVNFSQICSVSIKISLSFSIIFFKSMCNTSTTLLNIKYFESRRGER